MQMPSPHRILIYLLFTLSGFCALIYELLWTKHLSLTFGTTMVAVSAVAATFMGGLAIGSYLLGRYADRQTNLLRIYAALEVGIAICALLFPFALQLVGKIHISLHQPFPDQHLPLFLLHVFFAAILLLPPTACMGGTFPLMCRFFAQEHSRGQIGRLYALNTFGATAGAFLAGYLFIPVLGLSTTNHLAVGLNLAIAAASYLLARRMGGSTVAEAPSSPRFGYVISAKQHRPTLIAIGLIGFFSLAYEILWTRVLLLFLGNTTYAFSLMLSAYLIGIALGGALYARKMPVDGNEKKVFVTLALLMGLAILVTTPFYDQLAFAFQAAHDLSGERWWLLTLLSFGIVFIVMCVPTVLSGALLPAAVAMMNTGKAHTGQGVGLVVLYNTVGAVLGSLVAGFFLIPAMGLLNSFRLLAALNLLLALVLVLKFRPGGRFLIGVPAAVTIGLLLAAAPFAWQPELMNSGVYIYAAKYRQMGGLRKILGGERIVEVIEGRDTTVAVHESLDGHLRFFTVNGKTDGSNSSDMATQILVGHLPMLLHPQPAQTLVIGLGTGITLRGLSAHPTEQIDCVEISPEVVEAEAWFREDNGHALTDPKINLLIEDGRNLLLTSDKKYDVIISEPSNPWQTGNANLFTREFYALAASRLHANGLLCQWLGLYDITPDNLRIAVNTFLQSFPKALIFKSGADLIMVGGQREMLFDYQQLRRRLAIPEIGAVFAGIGIQTPGDLVAKHYLYSEEPLLRLAAGAPLNTDDRPILEFSARYNLGEKTLGEFQQQNLQSLRKVSERALLPIGNLGGTPMEVAAALRDLGKGFARSGRNAEAELFMRRAAEVVAKRN